MFRKSISSPQRSVSSAMKTKRPVPHRHHVESKKKFSHLWSQFAYLLISRAIQTQNIGCNSETACSGQGFCLYPERRSCGGLCIRNIEARERRRFSSLLQWSNKKSRKLGHQSLWHAIDLCSRLSGISDENLGAHRTNVRLSLAVWQPWSVWSVQQSLILPMITWEFQWWYRAVLYHRLAPNSDCIHWWPRIIRSADSNCWSRIQNLQDGNAAFRKAVQFCQI
jgi:hypothetical protein